MISNKKLGTLSVIDLVESLSIAMDLISPSIANHHQRVAFISWQLANELRLPDHNTKDLVISAMLHDCGALSMSNQLLTLRFEMTESEGFSITHHAETGYQLLKGFGPFDRVAEIIRYHHHPWNGGSSDVQDDIPEESYILHLADRLDVLLRKCSRVNVLSHRESVVEEIRRKSGSLFKPELIDPLETLFQKDSFWLDIFNMPLSNTVGSYIGLGSEQIEYNDVQEMTRIFSHIIDFRSNYTAYHSSMVSTVAGALARIVGFSEEECMMINISGNLHDLGKLAIPLEILEKPGKLTRDERLVINTHSYFTFKVLSKFRDFEKIRCWSAYHHEKIDGSGYPFKIGGAELDSGSRIVAVADVYAALRENRPYRPKMSEKKAVSVLRKMAGDALDGDVVNLLITNQPELEHIMESAAEDSMEEYRNVRPYLESQ